MSKLKYIAVLLVLFAASKVCAQQNPVYSQYKFNGLAINPAYAGAYEALSATFVYRNQWVDVKESPRTQSFSLHSPVFRDNFGIGLSLTGDRNGYIQQFIPTLSLSYSVLQGYSRLSFGLSGSLSSYNINWAELDAFNDGDVAFMNENNKAQVANAAAGVFYKNEKYFAGLSIQNLLQSKFKFSDETTSDAKLKQHYFATAGTIFPLSEKVSFRPMTYVKYAINSPLQIDLTATLIYKEKLWLGFTYATNSSYSFQLEYIWKKDFDFGAGELRLGYAYDVSNSQIKSYFGNSHELLLGYNFRRSRARVSSPRIF